MSTRVLAIRGIAHDFHKEKDSLTFYGQPLLALNFVQIFESLRAEELWKALVYSYSAQREQHAP